MAANVHPKNMRTWIEELEQAGELIRIAKPVDPLTQMGSLLYQSREKALFFENLPHGWRSLGQAPANVRHAAIAFGTTLDAMVPTIAERIKDYRAQNVADWVMYRKALAAARRAVGPSTGTTRKTCLMQRARRCTSRTSMHTSSKCGRPSGRLGTRITSSQWQRP